MNILWDIILTMLPIRTRTALPGKRICLLATITVLSHTVQAQEYDSIANKYKNEHAVITDYKERLVISYDDGKLVANSYVTEKRLLISDLAPGMYNHDYVYHSSSFNQLTDIQAYSSLPSKTGYKKTRSYDIRDVHADRDQIFYDDSRYAVVSFSGLVKKSLTEVSYSMEYADVHMLPRFFFQEDMPIVKATFEVEVPKYVSMSFVLKGEHTSWITQSKTESNSTVTYVFTATDVPAARAFENVPSTAYYIPHVIPYITSYKRYAEDKNNEMLANPDQLYKFLYKYISKINMVDDTLVTNTVARITRNDHTQREKAAHIYEWVQKNMHYVAFEDGLQGWIPREAKDICKRKYGDCKDMASILVAMCRKAGLDAYFTWIGTSKIPYTNEETPIPAVNNHMICALKLDGQWLFMDGTHPLVPFGVNPDAIQGKEAMVAIDAKTYKIITVPEANADKNITTDSTFISIDDSRLKGTLKQQYTGYGAWDIGIYMMYFKNEEREKYIKTLTERGSDKFLQTRYNIAASDTGGKSVALNADFIIDDYVQKVGKQYYVNMNLNRSYADKYIDTRGRTVPYFYKFKEKNNEVVVLDVPKGYHVTHLPPPVHENTDGLWGYKISYKADKNKIILVKEYQLNSLTASQKQFADNNKMVDGLKKAYKESVVLSAN